ncbi:Uncharacterised protein [BD1-7 clade bacterium]|uniref:Uncharacterized protein n=1 Tax=BD1-7 clade bacterium TaxID=2029982 RepID=A0A5S9PAC5_9GAMM|nr:Uncharacterised protein [BD1-7 clade bacterium]
MDGDDERSGNMALVIHSLSLTSRGALSGFLRS